MGHLLIHSKFVVKYPRLFEVCFQGEVDVWRERMDVLEFVRWSNFMLNSFSEKLLDLKLKILEPKIKVLEDKLP